jgi:D-sedoheptulose 7-phosphate isomerase
MKNISTPNRWQRNSIGKVVCREIEESVATKQELRKEMVNEIAEVSSLLVDRLNMGYKLIVFGNGGSAGDAQHFVAELVGRFRAERKPFAAIALTTNTSSLTAIGNDYGFEEVFARQLEGIGRAGDVAIAISTSGNSSNIVRAIETAKGLGMATIALTGRTGGKARELVDHCLSVPSDSTARIQEAHILIIHALSSIVEGAHLGTLPTSGNMSEVTFKIC